MHLGPAIFPESPYVFGRDSLEGVTGEPSGRRMDSGQGKLVLAHTFRRTGKAKIETRSVKVHGRFCTDDIRKSWSDHGRVHR
jgi:hypothetical protein